MGAADESEAGEGFGEATADPSEPTRADRSHNRDTLSSEAMTELLRDLQDTMLAFDQRLAALESAQGAATHDTSRLARGVVDMGEALTRRVRALEQDRQEPPPILVRRELSAAPVRSRRPRQQHRLTWIAALVFVAVVALGMVWLLSAETLDRGAPAVSPQPAVVAPAPLPPPSTADTTPPTAPPPVQAASRPFTPHRSAPWRRSSTHTPAASVPTPATTGFGHYGPGPSTAASASAPTPPPS